MTSISFNSTDVNVVSAWNAQDPSQTALEALEKLQWSVLPLTIEKKPVIPWKTYQTNCATEKQITAWQKKYNPAAWGVITGKISNLILLDFDGEQGHKTLQQLGLNPHVKTGSGGSHVYFQYPGWYVQTLNSKSKIELGKRWPGLDIRADGGYAAFCGRNLYGSYTWLRDFSPESLDILPEALRMFLGLMYSPAEAKAHKEAEDEAKRSIPRDYVQWALDGLGTKGRNDRGFELACQLRDNRVSEHEARAIMAEYTRRVGSTNTKGEYEPYTEKESLASLEEAYSQPARQPWEKKRNTDEWLSSSLNGNTPDPKRSNGHKAHLPDVILGGQLRDTTYYALKAMAEAEQGNPAIFVQTGRYTLVRVCKDKKNRPVLTPMAVPEIKHAMTQSANYGTIRENKKTGETGFVNMSPPKEVAEQILSLPPGDWPFPVLDAIVEIPQMRLDGSILDTPGYDKITQLYYMPHHDLDIPAIPSNPTKNEIDQAVSFVTGFLGDFPWVSPADHANALGLWLTTVLRQRVRHVPIALISANTQGAGKGLLTDATALLATGQTASSLSQVNSDEEWDKRITALLMAGATFVSIDNVEGMLRSPILSKALTADSHSGRVLGISKIVSVPQRAIWVANGNNIQLGGDMPRRCYPINMIVQVSEPWAREDFKYPYLIKALTENRGKIIAALLTMARGWIVAGQPAPQTKLRKLATFSEWVDLVGGILAYAGINGFLENLTEMHQKADIEGKAWTIFLEMWLTKLGDKEYYTAKELIEHWKADSDLQDTLPDPIATWFQDEAKTIKNKVGKLLAKKEGRPYGPNNLRIVKGDDTHAKLANFKVAGFAGFAGYKSSLRVDENSSDSITPSGINMRSANDVKNITHTTHTTHRDPTLCHMDGCTNLWDTEYAGKWLCSKHWIEARS